YEQDRVVDPSPEEPPEHAEGCANDTRDDGSDEPDQKRDAGAVGQASQIVTPEPIRSEPMLWPPALHPGRWNESLVEVLRECFLRHQRRPQHGHGRNNADDRQPDEKTDVAGLARSWHVERGTFHATRSRGSSRALRRSASRVRPI